MFEIILTERARKHWDRLRADAGLEKRLRALRKTLRFLSENPRHPSLRTHEFTSIKGPQGEKVFEAYAEQSTPAALQGLLVLRTGGEPDHGRRRHTASVIVARSEFRGRQTASFAGIKRGNGQVLKEV